MKKYYKILSIVVAFIFSILIICTVLSRVIETSSLKTVELAKPSRSELTIYEDSVCSVVFENVTAYSYGLPLKITGVFVEPNQKVVEGDLLATADVREYELDLKRRELSVMQMQNQIVTLGKSEERQLQLEIAESEYELYKSRFPENGEIRAESSGIISAVNICGNTTANSETVLLEIRDINAQAYAQFIMPEKPQIILT
jgi:multidrug efflux pump subunit AcrA (membrane-fusion protein)